MQLDYLNSLDSVSFLVGQQYDASMSQVLSFPAAETIKFGAPVSIDWQNGQVYNYFTKYGTAGFSFNGIAIRTNYQPAGTDIGITGSLVTPPNVTFGTATTAGTGANDQAYVKGAMVSIMKVGRIVVPFDNVTGTITNAAQPGGSFVWVNTKVGATNYAAGQIALASSSTANPFATGTTAGVGVVIGYTVASVSTTSGLVAIQIAEISATTSKTLA